MWRVAFIAGRMKVEYVVVLVIKYFVIFKIKYSFYWCFFFSVSCVVIKVDKINSFFILISECVVFLNLGLKYFIRLNFVDLYVWFCGMIEGFLMLV